MNNNLGSTNGPSVSPPIFQGLDNLAYEMETLTSLLESLESKLSPVLGAADPEQPQRQDNFAEPPVCELAVNLRDKRRALVKMQNTVSNLLSRIEL